MKKILIMSTGGTFNKIYDPVKGEFIIDTESQALHKIAKKWLCDFEILNLIGKDSLDMNNHDRLELLATINQSEYHHILIVHGTDTMDVTAEYLADADIEKCIVLTGAMVPYSMDPVEATANLCSAYGYINALGQDGVFIAMNGLMGTYDRIKKDRFKGKFTAH
ncbi:asparaginase domain-containing protein [Sulfurovum sp. TSL1]|uniref:asparaginase domain-containing protein n=1 Tax=Sulfurovum sp. TSL1 TaxID=2826994 RepID=UPI001CC58640|nr:asparaginase domain-containing protein [Sulfurovum sp. TSL1]GIT98001.1 asparaginase [Sulfurovum sp. TSL1]